MPSLLGELSGRLRTLDRCTEAIASQGLAYLLESSETSRTTLAKTIGFGDVFETDISASDIRYEAESVNPEEGKFDRVDIDGKYEEKSIIVIEAKFDAELTPNQPCEYLKRLSENGVLLFVCSDDRCTQLHADLKKKLTDNSFGFTEEKFCDSPYFLCDGNKALLVKSWDEILNPICLQLKENDELNSWADAWQLLGYCQAIGRNRVPSFVEADFLFDRDLPMSSCAQLVKIVFNELQASHRHPEISKKGLKYTPPRSYEAYKSDKNPEGFCYASHYFRWNSYGLGVFARLDLWNKSPMKTPFWLSFSLYDGWVPCCQGEIADKIRKYVKEEYGVDPVLHDKNLFLPLKPLYDASEEEMVKDLADQIEKAYSKVCS